MNAAEIKALGPAVWGAQSGLLSTAELDTLMSACSDARIHNVLEVGHYCGLSTCAIVTALRGRGGDWRMDSVDAHIPDPWVSNAASIETFETNRRELFNDPRLTAHYDRSETLSDVYADFVFYDGDHGAEQLRFTRLVIASPDTQIFLFDDRDFEFPRLCCKELADAGWIDRSPPLIRHGGDKVDPNTQTIAWFERC